MNWLVCFTLLLTTYVDFNCAAVNTQDANSVLTFLQSFGHLNLEKNQTIQSLTSKEAILKKSILSYQKFHRLNETGILDEQTKKSINKSRCGLPDHSEISSIKYKWNKKDLTYSIFNGYRNLNVKSIIEKAFSIWSKECTLNFQPQAGKSGDIKIDFVSGNHGDGAPFDGKMGVLAHAFFPMDGRIHFDSDEHFTDNTPVGINLLMVAVHEIGHALGLDHSSDPNSIMFPTINEYVENFRLSDYDLKVIKNMYGTRTSTKPKINTNDCADENENCNYWATIGECKANPNYMLTKCCKSCSNSNCTNENDNCESWARFGECEANVGYMLNNCCKSCKIWKGCKNKNDNCDSWARNGECEANPAYMLTSCCKSCKVLKDCKNENKNCEYWARNGECRTNPAYMLTKCCKSCQAAS